MLRPQLKEHKNVIFLAATEMSDAGTRLQRRIIEEGYATGISISVLIDMQSLSACLRLEIVDIKTNLGYDMFENDIINVRLNAGSVETNSMIYSNYGINQVYSHIERIESFNSIHSVNFEEELYQSVIEHIAFFQP
ncbi:hypothetical protein [Variovorax paradoxus]|jgi:hypothetical protein|uniref:hypothetical protein n=1 Tax=Variovorax paradoxus TaxID=34073 RepID=UPI0029C7E267|nr:hypothetical protein [Variovorax paradoxus]WPH20854.1 hypothetical protein RZE78_01525 [Variovorax paradoxus]